MPSGTLAATATTATVVACQNTIVASCRLTMPRATSRPLSVRRRATLTTSRWASAVRPHTATTPPSSSGNAADALDA